MKLNKKDFTAELTPSTYMKARLTDEGLHLSPKELKVYKLLLKYRNSQYKVVRVTNLAAMHHYGGSGFKPNEDWGGHNYGFRDLYLLKNKKTGKYTILDIDTGEPTFKDLWVDNIALVSWFSSCGLTWGEDAYFGILLEDAHKYAAIYPKHGDGHGEWLVKTLPTLTEIGEFTYTKYRKYYENKKEALGNGGEGHYHYRHFSEKIYQKFANYHESWAKEEELVPINDTYFYRYDLHRSADYGTRGQKEPLEEYIIIKHTPATRYCCEKWEQVSYASSTKELNRIIEKIKKGKPDLYKVG